MDRRNFLAFIPALSAIPIIGQNAERDKDKIIIYPEEAMPKQSVWNTIHNEIPKDISKAGGDPFVVCVYHKGKQFAYGYVKHLELRYGGQMPDVSIEAELFREPNQVLSFECNR